MLTSGNDLFKSDVPLRISGYSEKTWMPIYYEDDALEDEKIPGLTGFLESVYQDEIVWAANCRLDNDEYRFPEDRIGEHISIPIIPIILSKDCPPNKYEIEENWIRNKVNKQLVDNPERDFMKDRLFDDMKKSIPGKLGEYHHEGSNYDWDPNDIRYSYRVFSWENNSKPFIKIFYRNLIRPNENEYCNRIKCVLAHEYFHFVHDRLAGNLKNDLNGNVIESAADFFCTYFIGGNTANENYESWEKWFGSGWPYSSALYYFYADGSEYPCYAIKHPAISEKFERILETSCVSMTKAFSDLKQ